MPVLMGLKTIDSMKYVMLYHNNINCSSLYWCWWAEAPHCIDTVRASAHQPSTNWNN